MSKIKITTNQNEGHVRVNFLTEMATKTSTSNRPTSWKMYLTTAEQLELLNQRPCESMVEVKSPTTIGSAITLRSTIQSRGLGAPKQKFCGISIDKTIKTSKNHGIVLYAKYQYKKYLIAQDVQNHMKIVNNAVLRNITHNG